MKRTSKARFVGIGRETPTYVDKHPTPGGVFNKAEVIARQLRGEPVVYGEFYGSKVNPDGTSYAPKKPKEQEPK